MGVGWGGGVSPPQKVPVSPNILCLCVGTATKSDISGLLTTFLSCPVLLGVRKLRSFMATYSKRMDFRTYILKLWFYVVLIYIYTNTKKSLTAGQQSTPNLEKIKKMVKRVKFPDVSDSDWQWCIKLRLICSGFKVGFTLLPLFSNPSDLFL